MTQTEKNAAKKLASILVIDDEKSVCLSCRRILEEEDHHVEYETNAIEGLRLVVEGEFDIVLLDLKMPELTGLEALELIKRERPDVTVIIITGYATIQTSIQAIKKGAFDYVPKPFTPEELQVAVVRALENRSVKQENEYLRSELSRLQKPMKILGRSKAIEDIRHQILKVAPTDFTVSIFGESGTGKELIAHGIHENSDRAKEPFVAVDISALSPTLVESELFGHVKGAFTGATENRAGYFAVAGGGSLFLDEIANVGLELQGKLLRTLDTRKVRPVGGKIEQEVNVRIITATNRKLSELVKSGEFREDLYYRLSVIPIAVPPLRERTEDIPLLASHFLDKAREGLSTRIQGFSTEAMAKLIAYPWPGNIRQLANIVERLVATVDDALIRPSHLPPEISGAPAYMSEMTDLTTPKTVEELKDAKRRLKDLVYEQVEKEFIVAALESANENVSRAAEHTGMQRTNFHALMRRYDIKAKRNKSSK